MSVLWILTGIQVSGFIVLAVRTRRSDKYVNGAFLFFAMLIPVFGLLVFISLTRSVHALKLEPPEWLRIDGQHRSAPLDSRSGVKEIVPLEEALLISSPQQRRRMILSILHSDPEEYLDLLLLARFNEDAETAHYAASTITEIQRQMWMEILRLKAEVLKDPNDFTRRCAYVQHMARYCDSGLLEEQILWRQRCHLQDEIDKAQALGESEDLLCLKVTNLLALGRNFEAKQTAQRMLEKWPRQESAWLEAMRVAVETHDQEALRTLKKQMEESNVDWSKKGRELMAPWVAAS